MTEQEQIQAIKDWWKENGTQVLLVGCLVAVAYFGYNWWQNRQETQLNDVLNAYQQYLQAVGEANTLNPTVEQIKTVDFLTDQLFEEYGDTHYSFLANLNTAAFDFRRGEWESAADRLTQASEQAESEADVQLVNYRFALVTAQLGNIEQAVSLLESPNEQFASIYAEARGDILLSAGRSSEAMSAYQEAMNSAAEDDLSRVATLQATINSLQNGALALTSESE